MAIVGAICLAMLALSMGGPKVFEKVLPEDATAWLTDFGLGGTMSGDSGASSDNPQDHLRDTSDGWKPSAKIAAMPGNRAVFVKEVISGRSTSIEGDSPAAVVALTPVQDCRITPPSEGAFVGHVSAGSATGVTLGVSTYGDAELAAAVQQFAKHYRATGLRRVEGQRTSGFDAFDVAVTETARPVYLCCRRPTSCGCGTSTLPPARASNAWSCWAAARRVSPTCPRASRSRFFARPRSPPVACRGRSTR